MASIKLKGDVSGELTIQAPSVAGTNTLDLPASSGTLLTTTGNGSQLTGLPNSYAGTKNLIINGNMRIDQRNAGASVTPTNGSFVTDRFRQLLSAASKYTGQQVTDAPNEFTSSLKLTSSSAYTVGSAEVFGVEQRIEGNNISHLAWGTANAKDVTLSFWVKSSLTGTLSGAVSNNTDAAYPFDYTISSADTWEKKTINISGPTIGTWLTTNGVGISVKYMIGLDPAGTWANTPNVWAASNGFGATSQNVDIVGTSGATFYITGVQLEVGDTATDFEHLQYGQQLALCQRYFEPLINDSLNYNSGQIVGSSYNTTRNFVMICMKEIKRAAPTIVASGVGGNILQNNTAKTVTGINFTYPNLYSVGLDFTASGTQGAAFHYDPSATTVITADAEL